MVTDAQKLKAAVIAEVRKREKKASKSLKGLSKRITSRKLFKSKQPTITIKQKEFPSILGQPSTFFKSQLNEDIDEMNLFLK